MEDTFRLLDALERASLIDYDESSLDPLAVQPRLRKLSIKGAGGLETLSGLDALEAIEQLRIAAAPDLTDLFALGSRLPALTDLRFESCPGIDMLDEITEQTGLRWLGVNDCGRIDSIRPLTRLSHLERFHAWESTRVMDNDLSPLLSLPKLVEVATRDRRDYRPRVKDIQKHLATR